jgi:FkbM family methyltransferase
VDIGANEGMFSILMAKMFPLVRVYAYEPVPRTFFQMIRNIGLNGVTNITPQCVGVGKERYAEMNVHKVYSGGSSLVDTYDPLTHDKTSVMLCTLDEILGAHDKVKLLKIDIEGGEYDAIYDSMLLRKVENMVGEFHINPKLQSKGYSIEGLATYVKEKTNLIHYEPCRMAD